MLLIPKFNTSTIVCGNGQEVIHSSFDIVGAEFIIGYEAGFAEGPFNDKSLIEKSGDSGEMYNRSGCVVEFDDIATQRSTWLLVVEHNNNEHIQPAKGPRSRTDR